MVESMEDSHVIVLIESIRDFPQLWDPLNPDHGRKDISHQIWNTICNRCATYGVILTGESFFDIFPFFEVFRYVYKGNKARFSIQTLKNSVGS